MGLFSKLFVKNPNYKGEQVFEGDPQVMMNTIHKWMTNPLSFNAKQTKNASLGPSLQLEYRCNNGKSRYDFYISDLGEGKIKIVFDFAGDLGNAQESFNEIVKKINKELGK